MTELDEMSEFDAELAQLENGLAGAAGMAAAFHGELGRVQRAFVGAGRDVASLERGVSTGLRRAIRGAVVEGDSLSTSLRSLANSMINTAFNAAMRPVTDHVGGMLAQGVGDLMGGLFKFADGGSFTQGRVMPFANGGVVNGPVTFTMRRGVGLMGEAGPEAIMPLARGADGKLGVRSAGGGGPVNVVMNITTPDVGGFRRSQGQIAAQLGRAIGRGQRNR
ncbi:phage tail tape measure protein [Roseovarius nubinhibens]|uniref:Phage tail protein n=1 Tax=Roseovarius nubinhibens TaxID=314263 RepID=A0A348WAQ7_9RHOB|nr:phage tail protein [Roseovarius nubinhibens]